MEHFTESHHDPLYGIVQSAICATALAAGVIAIAYAMMGFHNPLNDSALSMLLMIIVFFVGFWYPTRRTQQHQKT